MNPHPDPHPHQDFFLDPHGHFFLCGSATLVSTTWLESFKMISTTFMQMITVFNSRMQISVKNFSFHAGVGQHFEICKNVVDRMLKNFGQ
jgi:hypothetical protein